MIGYTTPPSQRSLLSPTVKEFHELPDQADCQALLENYLQQVNGIFPMFQPGQADTRYKLPLSLARMDTPWPSDTPHSYMCTSSQRPAQQAIEWKAWAQPTIKLRTGYLGHLVGTVSLPLSCYLYA